jgi:hypothetical protein
MSPARRHGGRRLHQLGRRLAAGSSCSPRGRGTVLVRRRARPLPTSVRRSLTPDRVSTRVGATHRSSPASSYASGNGAGRPTRVLVSSRRRNGDRAGRQGGVVTVPSWGSTRDRRLRRGTRSVAMVSVLARSHRDAAGDRTDVLLVGGGHATAERRALDDAGRPGQRDRIMDVERHTGGDSRRRRHRVGTRGRAWRPSSPPSTDARDGVVVDAAVPVRQRPGDAVTPHQRAGRVGAALRRPARRCGADAHYGRAVQWSTSGPTIRLGVELGPVIQACRWARRRLNASVDVVQAVRRSLTINRRPPRPRRTAARADAPAPPRGARADAPDAPAPNAAGATPPARRPPRPRRSRPSSLAAEQQSVGRQAPRSSPRHVRDGEGSRSRATCRGPRPTVRGSVSSTGW